MIRFCPNCETERSLEEIFCEGRVGEQACGWNLLDEPIRPRGWRPATPDLQAADPLAPARHDTQGAETLLLQRCVHGHDMEAGDLVCLTCGAEPADDGSAGAGPASGAITPTEAGEADMHIIDGWRILHPINTTTGLRDCYFVQAKNPAGEGSETGGVEVPRRGILTLYHHGAEPDPQVYATLRQLDRDHVPEIYATGRWNDRAYEVAEQLTGGTLADLGMVIQEPATVRQVVFELGKALDAFAENGLRHRDIRPGTLLIRSREPLDMVIGGFGSARLSEFDLDIVSPLEITRYMAPEAVAGGVAAASDWWSLGMVLLEQVTGGECFANINPHAYLIHVLTHGVPIPPRLDPSLELLLRGLLLRDRHQRWQWPQVQAWLAGKPVALPQQGPDEQESEQRSGPAITLGAHSFHTPTNYALAAAEAQHWGEAREQLLRGALLSWLQEARAPEALQTRLRTLLDPLVDPLSRYGSMGDDFRLMLSLKILNDNMPLVFKGDIVTPRWLLNNPVEAYALISGPIPGLLENMGTESWLSRLQAREEAVRSRARNLEVELDENTLRIHLLSTSRASLAAEWEERRRLLPDTGHYGLLNLMERKILSDEDLIVILSAQPGQFDSADAIIEAAHALARQNEVIFDTAGAQGLLQKPRTEILQQLTERLQDFARCGLPVLDQWAEQFRLEKRIPLARALVLLAVAPVRWQTPGRQQYVARILEFFEKKLSVSILRGALVRMTIGKTTPRVDLMELGKGRRSPEEILDHILLRNDRLLTLDPAIFGYENGTTGTRLQNLQRHTSLYKRDTGIDGLYLGFPFLTLRDDQWGGRTRIAPLLLWPIKIRSETGVRHSAALAFDNDREEVRLNPALESMVGAETLKAWQQATQELLGHSALRSGDVMEALAPLAPLGTTTPCPLPAPASVQPNTLKLECAAVCFHITFAGQALGEDLRNLKQLSPASTALAAALRLEETTTSPQQKAEENASETPDAVEATPQGRHFTVLSDPSQERAVLQARGPQGLLVEGPPGTGKSQTIVNMVCDAMGEGRTLLIICQKHAALEVVRKRLVAEGLGKRIIMVNDINRDRTPIIKAIRQQVEEIQSGSTQHIPDIRRRKAEVVARMAALEKNLDAYYTALYRPLTRCNTAFEGGYRQLLGELIALEVPDLPLNVPALRPSLSCLSLETLAGLEEECAAAARYWLPARHEGSPLVNLKPFASDEATLEQFREILHAFAASETERARTLVGKVPLFEVEEPLFYCQWLAAYSSEFLELDKRDRLFLARLLPQFRATAEQGDTTGKQAIQTLQKLQAELTTCKDECHDPLLSPSLARLPEQHLQRLHGTLLAERQSTGAWWNRLNPLRHWRLMRDRHLLPGSKAPFAKANIDTSLGLVELELKWRPLRQHLAHIHLMLHLPPVADDAGPSLLEDSSSTLKLLHQLERQADILIRIPNSAYLDKAIMAGTREALVEFFASLELAFFRHNLRQNSLATLAKLEAWMEPGWVEGCTQAIKRNGSTHECLSPILLALSSLAPYQEFRGRVARLSPEALGILALLREKQSALEEIPEAELEEQIRRIIRREARLAWKHMAEQASPELKNDRETMDTMAATLRQLDAEMRDLNRTLLRDGVEAHQIGSRKVWEDITRLTGQRARRLREFIPMGVEAGLLKLRPVWLMNPDVASRILPLIPGFFDSVIYDEASQIPVEFAIPSLFRARSSIVSGDEKQMPPTAFFSSRVENDEALSEEEIPDGAFAEDDPGAEETWNRREIKDCPDLLQLARANLPNTRLQIHYRSAYRELINFSNVSFYNNELSVPVRHPESTLRAMKPIEMIQVRGTYQEQTNPEEARKVVQLLGQLWQRPYEARPSVGIVTFNRKQADLIEDLLEQEAEQNPEFRTVYVEEQGRSDQGEDMGVFVKNVENVQGDERDWIIFSTTFGRNPQGTFRRNFGVLGQKGGERRLNVAITRAKQKVLVVTSMPIADISDMLTTHRAPATPRDYLQGYMEYARTVSAGEFQSSQALLRRWDGEQGMFMGAAAVGSGAGSTRGPMDGFCATVMAWMQARGLKVRMPAERDIFGMDFIIEHPQSGQYVLAVDCDMPRHPLLQGARAREVWRPGILERVIPQLHRVCSHTWYYTPEKEQQRLQHAIDQAFNRSSAP